MTQKELIRQEVERLKNIVENDNTSEYLRGQARICRVILSFIDSLPEETCKDSLQVTETCKENPDSFTSLEEAAEKYRRDTCNKACKQGFLGNYPSPSIKSAFIAGAEWQKEQFTGKDKDND